MSLVGNCGDCDGELKNGVTNGVLTSKNQDFWKIYNIKDELALKLESINVTEELFIYLLNSGMILNDIPDWGKTFDLTNKDTLSYAIKLYRKRMYNID